MTPRSSRDKIAVEADVVRVWVMASPTDGEANKAVLRLLAKALSVAPSTLDLVRGETSREKVVEVPLELPEALRRLAL